MAQDPDKIYSIINRSNLSLMSPHCQNAYWLVWSIPSRGECPRCWSCWCLCLAMPIHARRQMYTGHADLETLLGLLALTKIPFIITVISVRQKLDSIEEVRADAVMIGRAIAWEPLSLQPDQPLLWNRRNSPWLDIWRQDENRLRALEAAINLKGSVAVREFRGPSSHYPRSIRRAKLREPFRKLTP